MLQYIRVKTELQETKTIVSFTTFDGVRVDISKKFLKKDLISNRWYFTKVAVNLRTDKVVTTKTYITLGEVYVVQCVEPIVDVDASGHLICSVTDLISFQEINKYRGTHNAEETYRS